MATFTGWIFSRKSDQLGYYGKRLFWADRKRCKVQFLSVAVVIWLMYVLKLMLLFTIVDLSLWYPKTLFSFGLFF